VKAAQKALDTKNPAHALIWVRSEDEAEVRAAFEQALTVRSLSPQAKALADRYFFETVVRLHRTGEGASYTGLKPAGRDYGQAIPAADRAIDTGNVQPVVTFLTDKLQAGIRNHFDETMASRGFKPDDVAAGREYVKAYVEFIHYIERLYESMTTRAQGHVDLTPSGR
jgi:hypothetical protein